MDDPEAKITFIDVVLGLMKIPNVDVYVTGSNSKMLSSDIFTQFRDRGDEIKVNFSNGSCGNVCVLKRDDAMSIIERRCNGERYPSERTLPSSEKCIDTKNNMYAAYLQEQNDLKQQLEEN